MSESTLQLTERFRPPRALDLIYSRGILHTNPYGRSERLENTRRDVCRVCVCVCVIAVRSIAANDPLTEQSKIIGTIWRYHRIENERRWTCDFEIFPTFLWFLTKVRLQTVQKSLVRVEDGAVEGSDLYEGREGREWRKIKRGRSGFFKVSLHLGGWTHQGPS